MTFAAAALTLLLSAAPDPAFIAEVVPSPEGAAALRALDARAEATERSPRVLLWKLSAANSAQVLAALDAKLPGHFAVVVSDGPKTRVPAGGVLVWLKPGVAPDAFGAGRVIAPGLVLLDSAPGVATLKRAVALAQDPRVAQAMPNWWLRAVRK